MTDASPKRDKRPTVYFDGSCGVCTGIASFIRSRDSRDAFRLVPIQSEEAAQRLAPRGIDTQNPRTMVLAEGDRIWTRSDSALRIARRLGLPWSLAWAFIVVPRAIRDAVYWVIARNRHRLPGAGSACPLPITDNTDHAAT